MGDHSLSVLGVQIVNRRTAGTMVLLLLSENLEQATIWFIHWFYIYHWIEYAIMMVSNNVSFLPLFPIQALFLSLLSFASLCRFIAPLLLSECLEQARATRKTILDHFGPIGYVYSIKYHSRFRVSTQVCLLLVARVYIVLTKVRRGRV